jgi:hypothetical protein
LSFDDIDVIVGRKIHNPFAFGLELFTIVSASIYAEARRLIAYPLNFGVADFHSVMRLTINDSSAVAYHACLLDRGGKSGHDDGSLDRLLRTVQIMS